MTFGEALRSLLSISGLKGRHLAMTLGYDVSYISRWTNDLKLPSAKNNDRLFRDIAAFFVSNSNESVRAEMAERLHLPCADPMDDEELSQALIQLLQGCYLSQAPGPKLRPRGVFSQNASFMPGEFSQRNILLWDALSSLPADVSQAEIITTTPIHRSFWRNEAFFQHLNRVVMRPVHIWQFLCLEDIQAHLNESFRALFYLLSAPYHIQYGFYELEPSQIISSFFLLRDRLLQMQTASPFSDEDFFVITQDPAVIRRYWGIARKLVDCQKPLVHADTDWRLLKGRFGVNFLMQSRLRCILKFISTDIFVLTAEGPASGSEADRKASRHRQVMSLFDSIILYKETIIEYVMGTRQNGPAVSKEQRISTLKFFIDQALSDTCKLLILDAANSCCNYDDLRASACAGSHHACVMTYSPEKQELAYTISNRRLVDSMNLWFDNLEALPQDQCLTGEAAADYIARCMRLI